jgi:dinuclear metal center YbgI/SA1388 family protein
LPTPTVAAFADYLCRFAPPELAAEWDNVGLLLGDPAAKVKRVMTCLTVTPASVAEAVEEKVQLIVSHHPVLFRPTQRLTADNPEGAMLLALLRAGVAVHSPHTAFDNTEGGINDLLCRKLGLSEMQPLRPAPPGQCKIVVFVPEVDLAKVSDALFAAGAGLIGQYSQCSFRIAGTGTFFGSEDANPTVGKKGRREEAPEWRLEVVCPEKQVEAAIRAMRKAHSYEEPAFDVYPLRPAATVHANRGHGRVGLLPNAMTLRALADRVKQVLKAPATQMIGARERSVHKVAVVCGAGSDFLRDAHRSEADVLLTGELRFHDQLAAEARGLAVILPGHYATERPGVEMLAERLAKDFPATTVWASRRESDVGQWL